MPACYYTILGISSMATVEEVRAAYRRLVKAYHPDHYPGNSERFRQVQEAYSVLGDEKKRRQYENQTRRPSAADSAVAPMRPKPEPLIPDEAAPFQNWVSRMALHQTQAPSLGEVFEGVWNHFSHPTPLGSGRVEQLTIEVPISRNVARRGGTLSITVPQKVRCPLCRGDGTMGPYVCNRCGGQGAVSVNLPAAIAIPPGIMDNPVMVIPPHRCGLGNCQVTLVFRISDPIDPLH